MKIVVLDGHTLNPGDLDWSNLADFGELQVYDRTPPAQITQRIGDAQIVFTNKTPLTAEIFAACPELRFVGVLATGYNIIDLQAAKIHNVVVSNVPAYGTMAVAQYVFALLLEVCHHVGAHSQAVAQGAWGKQPDFCFWNSPLIELAGKTFGVIGMGKIGTAAAQIAQSFGMKVLAYDPQPQMLSCTPTNLQYTDFDTVLAYADVISLHCPLTATTQELICQQTLSQMKPTAILINTSRGPLVNEADLAAALNNNQLFAYAADVATAEPIPENSPLLTAKQTILTPHIAWAPKESRQRLLEIAIKNLAAFLDGNPIHTVTTVSKQ